MTDTATVTTRSAGEPRGEAASPTLPPPLPCFTGWRFADDTDEELGPEALISAPLVWQSEEPLYGAPQVVLYRVLRDEPDVGISRGQYVLLLREPALHELRETSIFYGLHGGAERFTSVSELVKMGHEFNGDSDSLVVGVFERVQ